MVRCAALADLHPVTLYNLLRLRVDVFVVEQRCAYAELDGRDIETSARHYLIEQHGQVIACLRVLAEPDGSTRIGRVATARSARRSGHAARLVAAALAAAPRPVVVQAQAHLADWYAAFGFSRDGDDVIEDGIVHTPMRLS